ncbi:ABC transporter substrate-binding protein [Roseomonas sp. BN140053]|uniref:ABC transporter substrate-binding protein n=1 Tax=Roseomonas sp. BN140053 TaxID=3391898 RepID=UPI0039EA2D4C
MNRCSVVAGLVFSALLGTAEAAERTATLGVVTAQSGPLAAAGRFQLNGFELAVDNINRAGGLRVGGDTVRLVLKVYDTRCNAAEGANAMQRLATVDEVPVVLGEVCSPAAAAEAPVAADFDVPMITTVPTAPNLTEQNNRYFFRVNADNGQLNRALADYVVAQNLLPLAFIAWNNDAGRGGVNGMRALLPAGARVAYTGYFNVGEVDFSAHISNLRSSGARAVMLLMDEEPGALAIRQIRDAGLDVQLIGTLAMGSNRFLDRLNARYLAGMVQYNAFPPNAPVDRIRAFNETYRARFNEEAHGFAAQSYDAVYIAAQAMVAAGSSTDGKKIRDALARTDHQGVIGRIRFDARNQADPPVYITEWCADGSRKITFPAEMASACGGG